jgi:hypothetical protein
MTGDQARNLKPGAYLCWEGDPNAEIGVITQVNHDGVSIRWSDGRMTTALFNDMKQMRQTDIDGRSVD